MLSNTVCRPSNKHFTISFFLTGNHVFSVLYFLPGIAIAVAFLVILFTTFNLVLSLYSIVTITFIISVTVGILILSGWRLNILESIVFSVAAGLSADFTLHYSVAYQTSLHKNDRIERVKGALSHIGPAILMGACTTFIAGKLFCLCCTFDKFDSRLQSTTFYLYFCTEGGYQGYLWL